jgi:glycosyltransferase involved in cell wall biosynthesis
LILIGNGPDAEYFSTLIHELQLEKNIEMKGFVSDVQQEYANMDMFVFPTIWELEGFGMVVVEAMAHGLPVIASSQGPVPEIIESGVNGKLFPPGDENALAEGIIELLSDTDLLKRYGKKGRALYEQKYEIRIVASLYIQKISSYLSPVSH